jgi:hypothetical protein
LLLRVNASLTTLAAVVLLWLAAATTAGAQRPTRIYGVVRDSASGTPLRDAIITASFGDSARTARSDSAGKFVVVVPATQIALTARHLGYRSDSRRIDGNGGVDSISILLAEIPRSLAEIRVTANATGVRGIVGSSATLSPLSGAHVRVLGNAAVATDSSGRFFVPISKAGTYALRISAGDYADRIVSVEIEDGKPLDLSILLDRATSGAHLSEMALDEFDQRQRWLGAHGALIPSEQLVRYHGSLADAIEGAPSFVKGLRLGSTVCVFINGQPKPAFPLNGLSVDEVTAIEVYAARGDDTHSLASRWPGAAPCSQTQIQTSARSESLVRYAGIWTK